MGAGLDEQVVARLQRGPGRLLESHGLAQVPVPVLGVERGRVEGLAGDGREERHVCRLWTDRFQ